MGYEIDAEMRAAEVLALERAAYDEVQYERQANGLRRQSFEEYREYQARIAKLFAMRPRMAA